MNRQSSLVQPGQSHWTQVQMLEPKEGPPPDDSARSGRASGDYSPGKGSTSDDVGGKRENQTSASGRLGYESTVVDDASTVKTSGAIGYGADGGNVVIGRERTLDATKGDQLTMGTQGRYGDGRRASGVR